MGEWNVWAHEVTLTNCQGKMLPFHYRAPPLTACIPKCHMEQRHPSASCSPLLLMGPAQLQGGAKSLHCLPVPGEFAWLWRPQCPLAKDKWPDLRCDWTREGLHFKSQLRTNTQESNCDYSKPWSKPCPAIPIPGPDAHQLVICCLLGAYCRDCLSHACALSLETDSYCFSVGNLLRYWMGSAFKHRFL